MFSDPIVALATPPGRSALAMVRVSGSGVFEIAARCLTPFQSDPDRAVFLARMADPITREPIDEVVATCYRGPRSYTGEDMVELSTHGGLLIPAEVVSALVRAGARAASPGEFTRRAVLNGKMDLLQAEATADLIDAGAPAQRRQALQQLERGLSERLSALRSEVLALEALIAYEIDFPEEDEGSVDPERVRAAWSVVRERVATLLSTAPEGERVREGALLVIAGPPNAGKSSLFNALLGSERAIVTEIAGTTRDAIEASAVIEGFPFRLVDTAGLRQSTDRVERMGIEVSRRYLNAADLVLYCEESVGRGALVPSQREEFLESVAAPIVFVQTKVDLMPSPSDRAPVRLSDAVQVSIITGQGVAELRRRLAATAFGNMVSRGGWNAMEPVVTRARHRAALERALAELDCFAAARANRVDAAAAATHLRAAVTALDDLIGVVTPDDVLDRVFGTFCVGK